MASRIAAGAGGLDKVVIETADGVAEVYRLGATVTRCSWRGPKNQAQEVIFVSRTSPWEEGKAIRGGVPICFPWFGLVDGHPELPQHGVARTRVWEVESLRDAGVTLLLRDSPQTRAIWDHAFELRMSVELGARKLSMALEARNTCTVPWEFGEALHTYFAVPDVTELKISGLGGRPYVDKNDGMKTKVQAEEMLRITGPTDRVYANAPGPHEVSWPGGGLVVRKTAAADSVVWNPWTVADEKMKDLGGRQWPGFVCVEAVNTGGNAIRLVPGARHEMRCEVEAVG